MRAAPPPGVFDEPLLSKATVKTALAMAALIVCGVLGVAGLMKLHGYGRPDMMDVSSYEWNVVAVFFRNHGFQLLWIPVLWTLLAVYAQRRDRGEAHNHVLVVGLSLIGIFVILFFCAALRPVKQKSLLLWLAEKRAEREAVAAAQASSQVEAMQ